MRRLISEMRRRRVFRTAALYIVATWLVMQVSDVVFPALDIEERAIRYVLLAAILSFPAAIVFGWFYDVGADGIRRTAPAGADEVLVTQPFTSGKYWELPWELERKVLAGSSHLPCPACDDNHHFG